MYSHEKPWIQSKKFVAFLVTQLGFFALLGALICTQDISTLGNNLSFMILAVTSGILASFYIGGQALVDRYIRVAMITMGHGVVSPHETPEPSEDEKKEI